jgi:hypothetical protein
VCLLTWVQNFDSREKVCKMGGTQVIIAIASAIVGRVSGCRVDLCLGHPASGQKRMDRMAQCIRRSYGLHQRPYFCLANFGTRRQPDGVAVRILDVLAEAELGMSLPRLHQTGLEGIAKVCRRTFKIIGSAGITRLCVVGARYLMTLPYSPSSQGANVGATGTIDRFLRVCSRPGALK